MITIIIIIKEKKKERILETNRRKIERKSEQE